MSYGTFTEGSEPELVLLATKRMTWRLHAPVTWHDAKWGVVTAPEGFVTDLASIPRMFPYKLHQGLIQPCAIIHDWIYSGAADPDDATNYWQFTRWIADRIFFRAMMQRGVGVWRAHLYYWAVRGFGWRSWRPNTGQKTSR